MNNKGFTLIEAIMVVAIIAVLAVLFTPNILALKNQNSLDVYNSTIKTIEHAAENYVSDNRYNKDIVKVKCPGTIAQRRFTVKIEELVDAGYLSKIPESTCNKNSSVKFNPTDKVTVEYDCTKKQFSYFLRAQLTNVNSCIK